MALAIDFALVVLGGEIDGHREFRLALQDLCRVRGGRDVIREKASVASAYFSAQ